MAVTVSVFKKPGTGWFTKRMVLETLSEKIVVSFALTFALLPRASFPSDKKTAAPRR